MNKIVILLFLIFSLSFVHSQEYQDLLIYRVDQNWQKLIQVAEKYTLKESTKNDPLPYYYMAYGLYKISFIGNRPEQFQNAFKDAIGVVGKLGRKDPDKVVINMYASFFEEFKGTLFEMIRNDIEADDYRRSFGWVMKMYKFDRDDIGAKFLEGACRYRNGDKSTAKTKWQEAKGLIENLESLDGLLEIDSDIIKFGLYESAKCQIDARQVSEAQAIMNLGSKWFEDDADWINYRKVIGI